ncbi:tyrosine--tRNA ligase [Pararhodospirillum oryzae]|uniref:Tyrosine--tRNA ligase n=1 Tax=Pararhodospirillum oryzae TaxID=478448 RepID=A0A512HA50_9PROT|nr:tyrosine--tRNA ligase [Pararhodospirillum oryzae]GEO82331.1 tyrosine--tRNA ligase [Pararhodospirillum oryzae]
MTALASDFLAIVHQRGFVHQVTDLAALDALMAKESVRAYIGFDCTANSLHVGSLLQIMLLRWLQKTGHRPVVLMGGGTTRIGDPSFRDEARPLLTDEQIGENMAGIRQVFDRFLTFGDSGTGAVMVNNADWLDDLAYIPFLRDVGRHFSVNRMLSMESVRLRLDREQPLSFLEFNYMILQAYDFVELSKRVGVRLQMGGSDQWGNIVSGTDLGRRLAGTELFGLTSPLITTASGAKMGKTAQGAVWLNAARLAPYDYWQFWRNTEDADVGRFMRLFTELPLDEIARLEALGGAEINEAKKILAHHATALAHGEEAALAAAETARQVFEQGGAGDDLPTLSVAPATLAAGLALAEVMRQTGLATSGKEVKRLIAEGGLRVNDEAVSEAGRVLGPDDLRDGVIKLSAGKKRHALVRVEKGA